ncbi:MAG: ribonuclease R [Oscillospiraceae bacterium]|nr:ribonuclease R [Oscillospiraceae bacterium]
MANNIDICTMRIKNVLEQKGKKSLSKKELFKAVKGKRIKESDFRTALNRLVREGTVFESQKNVSLAEARGYFPATVERINKTFGFIKPSKPTGNAVDEIFVPGKCLHGALPGDTVLATFIASRDERPEAEILSVIDEGQSEFSGIAEQVSYTLYVRPDKLCRDPILVIGTDMPIHAGDKVLAKVTERGTRHSEHRCRITALFGSADKAVSSALSVLYMNDIETQFPLAVIDEAKHCEHMGITEKDIASRLDLRDEIIFTIDGADTKDIDDAVSVSKTDDGYRLGVHIADVSRYVKPNSELDKNAFLRGTSIYYANKVIPMLPPELSNGICSLNPMEDRLAFSCLMELDSEGNTVKFKFSKTVIRSRVKGVYSEINRILECGEELNGLEADLAEKYKGLIHSIFTMKELADKLTAQKIKRGAPQIETAESKLIINDDDVCVDVQRRSRGAAEILIEEFMLKANECAARIARENDIPFVYRVHESPSPERIADLHEVTARLNIPFPEFSKVKPVHLARILESAKGMDAAPIVNTLVLRSMAKAKYADEPLGHFGLVLDDYAHFTSPIRRYPDLAIHRILTELCYDKTPPKNIKKRYEAFAKSAAMQSSQCELTAMHVERDCDDCYIAEYMSMHLDEEFDGIICSVTDYGMYVQLENTVEGLVRIETLPDGTYEFDGLFNLSRDGVVLYAVGQRVRVRCVGTDISSGKVDFVIV